MSFVDSQPFAPFEASAADATIRAVIDAMPDSIGVLDANQTIVMVNKSWYDFCNRHDFLLPGYGIGKPFLDIARKYWSLYSLNSQDVSAKLSAICAGEQGPIVFTSDMQVENEVRHYQVTLARIEVGEETRIIVAHNDVTAVARLAEERREGAIRLLQAQLEDRRRVGRELHDSVAQNIAAIALSSARLRSAGPSEFEAAIDDLDDLVAAASRDARAYSYLLHPPALSEVGLKRVLEQYIAGFSRRTGIAVSFDWHVTNAKRLAPAAPALLRIVQEALANVYRHSGAKTASVRLSARKNQLSLEIADQGHGMSAGDQEMGVGHQSVGIASMRARAVEMGGALSIASTDHGTRVTALLPLA